jgi:hypothetical protein
MVREKRTTFPMICLCQCEMNSKPYITLSISIIGGGLGTSKPVQFRIILNENAVFRPNSGGSPLTKELLEQATYEMSFQYSTATKVSYQTATHSSLTTCLIDTCISLSIFKAVRLVPVVCYSARCSETVLKYISCKFLNHICDIFTASSPQTHTPLS